MLAHKHIWRNHSLLEDMPQEESKRNELSKFLIINDLLSYNQPPNDWAYAEIWGWKPYSLQKLSPAQIDEPAGSTAQAPR